VSSTQVDERTEVRPDPLSTDLVIYGARLLRALRRAHDVPAGMRVLSLLDEHGPLTVTRLAKLDQCSQPTMSAAVAQMSAAGLVVKEPNPLDARGSIISMTDLGRQSLAQIRGEWATTISDRLRARKRTQGELATTVSILRNLVESTETFETGGPG
jgi:DNA-binding MarR family transcriptional regulator